MYSFLHPQNLQMSSDKNLVKAIGNQIRAHFYLPLNYHGTIIRTGVICKKIPCVFETQQKLKYFEFMLNIFFILLGLKNCGIFLSLCK